MLCVYIIYLPLHTHVSPAYRYQRYLWKTSQGHDDSEVLHALPFFWRKKVTYELYGGLLRSCPFLSMCLEDAEFLAHLTVQLR